MKEHWERVTGEVRDTQGGSNRLERIEVPGGWLYRTWVGHRSGVAVSLTFVPEPERTSGFDPQGVKALAWALRIDTGASACLQCVSLVSPSDATEVVHAALCAPCLQNAHGVIRDMLEQR